MTLTYLKAGDAMGAVAAYKKVKEHITPYKMEMILRRVKGTCGEKVYHIFEAEVYK